LYGAKNMNMISTGAFQTEMDASNKQNTLAEKFVAVWEKKNAKAARAGGVSLMALSLAACGSDDATTTSTTTTTTTTTTTPASQNANFTSEIDNLTGGAGDDTFTGDTNTVSEADQVAGGAGADTVKIYGNTGLPTMTGVETFYQKSLAAGLDVSTNGVTAVELDTYSLAAARTVKLGDSTSLTLSNTTGTANAITLSNNTATAQTITMTKSGDATNAIDFDIDGDAVATLSISSTDTGTTGTSYTNIANTGAKLATVNVTGSGDLVIENVATATAINITSTGKTTLDTAVAKVVVTGGAGADTITLDHATGTAREFTVTTGAGDDKISLGTMVAAGDLTDSKVTLDGGDGNDTLSMAPAMGAVLSALTAANYAKKGIANTFETIDLNAQATAGDALGLARVGSNVTTVDYSAGLGDAQTLTGLASGGTVILGAAASAASDGTTVTVLNSAAAGAINDSLTIKVDPVHAGGTLVMGTVTAANVETVTLNSTTTKATALVALDKNDVDLIIANASTLNITGNAYVDLSNDLLDGVLQVVDASANTAGVDVETDGAEAVKMTGTAKADVLKTDSGADNIVGGAGNDTITSQAGNDTIDGGAGNDVIDAGADNDTITLGTGADDVVIAGDAAAGVNQDKNIVKGFTVADDDIDVNASLIDGGNNSAAVTDYLDVTGAATNSFTANATTGIYEFSGSADFLGEGVAGTFDATATTVSGANLEAAVIEQLVTDVAVAQTGSDIEHLILVMYDEAGNAVIVNYSDSTIATEDTLNANDFFEFYVLEDVAAGTLTAADFV
jgi:Ca2+-binding RTX toxin-like protein